MGVERMGCGCLTSVYRDAGRRVHGEDCMFSKDSTLMERMYNTYAEHVRDNKTHEPMTYDEWQRHFNFKG